MSAQAKLRSNTHPALERLREALLAIPRSEVRRVNLDVDHAVKTISKTLPRMRELRPRMQDELPRFDVSLLDQLPVYASALAEAHALCQRADAAERSPGKVFEKAKALRSLLIGDASALAGRRLIPAGVVETIAHANGYANVAMDLELLSGALREAWPRIQGRTPVTVKDLDAALEFAARLREPSPAEQAVAARARARDLRARAFTLTMRAYREIRRAVSYLCEPEGDAETFAPQLHLGRPR